ncbi:MAG: hypothetical protein M3Q20_05605, partial [Actinomycetota bacterium]|nr:hypothetical protein [Actinomycetota bacterium]
VRPGDIPRSSYSHRSRRLVGIAMTLPAFLLAALLVLPGGATADEGEPEFETRSGIVPPGGSLTTLDGPLDANDPFAVALKNVSDQPLDVTIEEERCDGSDGGDPLCSEPRVGGVAGDFIFQPSGGGSVAPSTLTSTPAVVVARLYYDVSLLEGVRGVRIFWQKTPEGPVMRLPRCDDGQTTECFRKEQKANGDQIIRIRLQDDPRFTRG